MRLFSGGGLLLSCFPLYLTSVLAVFQDDAFHIDWHIPLIGSSLETSTFFHRPNSKTRASLVYTLTDRSILAAINPKDGELVWRQSLAEEPVGMSDGVARRGNGIIIAGVRGTITSLDASNGKIIWENEFSDDIVDLRVFLDTSNENAVAVLFKNGAVRLLHPRTGDVAWQWNEISRKDAPVSIHIEVDTITVVSVDGSKTIRLTALSPANGEVSSPALSISASTNSDSKFFAGDSILSWTEHSGKTLKLLPLGRGSSPTAILVPSEVLDIKLVFARDIVLIQYKTSDKAWADVYKLDSSSKTVHKVHSLEPKEDPNSAFSLSALDERTYLVWTQSTGETSIYDSESKDPIASYQLPENINIDLVHAVSEVMPRQGGKSFAQRTFLSSRSPGFNGNTHLIRNGELAWSRNESLASIVKSAWIELLDPVTEEIVGELDVETHTNVAAAYIHRVRRHLHELAVYGPGWLQSLPRRISSALLNKDISNGELTGKWRDFFGFRKFAVVVTQDGGLAAIDVGRHGEIVWKASLVDANTAPFSGVSAIHEVRKGTVGIVLISGEYIEYDAFHGKLLHQEKLLSVVQATASVRGPGQKTAFVVLLESQNVVVLPSGSDIRSEFIYLTTKDESGVVSGLRVSTSSARPVNTWTFVPPVGEEITTVATRPAHDPVASIGKVLGDRSVMYKYLNQHLIVITTINPNLSTATVYLLDSVSGTILHTATHAGVDTSQPIVTVVSENWVVYTYFGDDDMAASSAAKGYHLVVLELYESQFRNDRGVLGPAANVSSFATGGQGKPYTLSQSYIFPQPITTFAVSTTKQGITSREVLALLPGSSGIYTIPKRVLDPRRPVGRDPDVAEREEGLFPYVPAIEIDPKGRITHQRTVMGMKQISTTPSELESTCIVLAFGGDLFGTRVAPSMAFDILGKGFGKVQLVLTVVGLAIGTAFVAPMVRRKQINSRWSAT